MNDLSLLFLAILIAMMYVFPLAMISRTYSMVKEILEKLEEKKGETR